MGYDGYRIDDAMKQIATKATVVPAPATLSSAGTVGQIAADTGFIYFCIAANTWVKCAVATS